MRGAGDDTQVVHYRELLYNRRHIAIAQPPLRSEGRTSSPLPRPELSSSSGVGGVYNCMSTDDCCRSVVPPPPTPPRGGVIIVINDADPLQKQNLLPSISWCSRTRSERFSVPVFVSTRCATPGGRLAEPYDKPRTFHPSGFPPPPLPPSLVLRWLYNNVPSSFYTSPRLLSFLFISTSEASAAAAV